MAEMISDQRVRRAGAMIYDPHEWGLPVVARNEGVAVMDARAELPVNAAKVAAGKGYRERQLSEVKECIVHHTAGGVHPFPEGLQRLARFFVKPKALLGRGWPGFAYHYWIPHSALVWGGGWNRPLVVFQTQDVERCSYHTKGHNRRAISVVCQGRYTKGVSPPALQVEALVWLCEILARRHEGVTFVPHADAGKPACPGDVLGDVTRRINHTKRALLCDLAGSV